MKKKYEQPKTELIKFNYREVMAATGDDVDPWSGDPEQESPGIGFDDEDSMPAFSNVLKLDSWEDTGGGEINEVIADPDPISNEASD